MLALQPWLADRSARFCGFYVAKADTKLFNQASQVVLVRDGDRTVSRWPTTSRATRRSSPS